MPDAPVPRTARERARTQLIGDIKASALRQLAGSGPAGLSLRQVSRDLGMVSSALYRYFPSRDALLTALIVDAFSDLADALARAGSGVPPDAYRRRWLVVCAAFRDWARAEPHRFALVYGSPVPGYRAPQDTIAPAERVMTALSGVVEDAAAAGALTAAPPLRGRAVLSGQLQRVGQVLGEHIDAPVLARTTGAFAQLVGFVNLELAGHFVGGFEPADELFHQVVEWSADALGL